MTVSGQTCLYDRIWGFKLRAAPGANAPLRHIHRALLCELVPSLDSGLADNASTCPSVSFPVYFPCPSLSCTPDAVETDGLVGIGLWAVLARLFWCAVAIVNIQLTIFAIGSISPSWVQSLAVGTSPQRPEMTPANSLGAFGCVMGGWYCAACGCMLDAHAVWRPSS